MHRLHGVACCAPSIPTLEKLILDIISLDYHETLFAAAGHQIEAARKDAAMEKNKGKYLLVVEGAIPMKDGGIYCKIGGQTSLELTARMRRRRRGGDRASARAPRGAACRPRRPTRPARVGVAEALGRNDIRHHSGLPAQPLQLPRYASSTS